MIKNKKHLEIFFVFALFLFGFYYYCIRIVGIDFSSTPGDYVDSRFINFILEHGYRWIRGFDPDFWTATFMYPLKNNVAISDSMAGTLPIYACFRFFGANTETAYQSWWLSIYILNYWFCFIAFKKIDFNNFTSAIGAYVFAFGINNLNQFPHLQFSCKFFIPISLAFSYLFLCRPTLKNLSVFVFSVVFQFYATPYLGIILIYFILLFFISFLAFKEKRNTFVKQFTGKKLLSSVAIITLGFLLILVIAIPHYQMAKYLGARDYKIEILPNLPRIYSYFFPNNSSISWDFLKNSPLKSTGTWYIHDLFPGAFCYSGLLVCIIYFVYMRKNKRQINILPIVLFTVLITLILLTSKNENDFSFFKYFRSLPGLDSMRVTTRFMIVGNFILIWLCLFFVKLINKNNLVIVYLIFTTLVICDNLFEPFDNKIPITSKQIRLDKIEKMCAIINSENTENKKIIAYLNISGDNEVTLQLDVMLAAQKLNLYTLNGYSSNCFGDLCSAYNDTSHIKLSKWLQNSKIDEKNVLYIIK